MLNKKKYNTSLITFLTHHVLSITAWRRKSRVFISASDIMKSLALGSGRLTHGDSAPDTHWNSPSQTGCLWGRKIQSRNGNGTPFLQPSSRTLPPPITYNNSFQTYVYAECGLHVVVLTERRPGRTSGCAHCKYRHGVKWGEPASPVSALLWH